MKPRRTRKVVEFCLPPLLVHGHLEPLVQLLLLHLPRVDRVLEAQEGDLDVAKQRLQVAEGAHDLLNLKF